MTIDEVIEAIEVEPFQPLEVTLRDGRRFPVVEQEHIQPTVEQGLHVFKPPRREGEPSEGVAGYFEYDEVVSIEPLREVAA